MIGPGTTLSSRPSDSLVSLVTLIVALLWYSPPQVTLPAFGRKINFCPKKFNRPRKCQQSFSFGLIFLFFSMLVGLWAHMSLFDALVIGVLMVFFGSRVYMPKARAVFHSASISAYWRWGYAKQNNDAFQLDMPVRLVQKKAWLSRKLNAFYKKERLRTGDVSEGFQREVTLLDII